VNSHLEQRTVSDDPAITQAAVEGFAAGLQSQGVRAVLKHFPGLGSAVVDTHLKPAELTKTVDEMRAKDWVPFVQTIKTLNPPPAVMLGHASLPDLDPVRLVSYSPRAADLLRKEAPAVMTITDCYSMGPIWNGPGGVGGATCIALESGVDFILFAWDGEAYFDGYGAALTQAKRSTLRVEAMLESNKRILAYRSTIFLPGAWEKEDPLARLKRGEAPRE
jgi:beta-N-acetylhexosaminidase